MYIYVYVYVCVSVEVIVHHINAFDNSVKGLESGGVIMEGLVTS